MQQVLQRPLAVPEFAWIRSVATRVDGWLEVFWSPGERADVALPARDAWGCVLMQPPPEQLPLPAIGDLVALRDDGSIRSWTDRHDGRLPPPTVSLEGPTLFVLAPGDTATVTRFENPAGGALPFPRAFAAIRRLMIEKRPTKGEAWREQPVEMHVGRMAIHAARAVAGEHADTQDEDDLVHAVVRGLMALERREAAR